MASLTATCSSEKPDISIIRRHGDDEKGREMNVAEGIMREGNDLVRLLVHNERTAPRERTLFRDAILIFGSN
jgi:hypothetical protein